jgi:methionine-S-sulfoxide reductase
MIVSSFRLLKSGLAVPILRRESPTEEFNMSTKTERAVLAGGCFWGMQDLIRRYPGVISTRVGYTGGEVPNATYRNHGNHAEAIEIVFDPARISFRDLLEFFFQIHDPTTRNRQGNDVGASYRSAIFYLDDEQKQVAEDTIADVNASGIARQGRDRGDAGRRLLGSRARASGLPGALSQRLHLPLPAAELEAAEARRIAARIVKPVLPCRAP